MTQQQILQIPHLPVLISPSLIPFQYSHYKQNSKHAIPPKMLANNNELPAPSRQIELELDGALYRMDRVEYNDRHMILSLGTVYLITLMLLANAYNLAFLLPNKIPYVLVYSLVVMVPLGVPIFKGRQKWPLLMTNYIILLLNIATDVILPPGKVFIAGGVYGGVMLLASFVMLQERKLIAGMVILVLEGVLIQLKASGVIVQEWNVVLLPITAAEVCLFIALTILLIMAAMQGCVPEGGRSALWGYRLGVKVGITSMHFVQLGLPIAIVYSQGNLSPLCVIGVIMGHHLILVLLIVFKREHIVCCFATPTQEISILQRADAPSAFEKTIQRVSSHWFAIQDKTAIATPNQNPQSVIRPGEEANKEECLICLSDPACMIWSPCGHLSTCEKCGNYLVSQGRLSCLLCKKDARRILKVDIGKPQGEREYSILKEITIIRASVYRS